MVLMDDHRTEEHVTSPHNSVESAAETARPQKTKKTQQRTCIVTREEHHKSTLLRFVCDKQGRLYFDAQQALPGRGMYILPKREYIEQAIAKSLFAKAAKRKLDVSETLLDHIEAQLRQSVLDHLGLTRRSGNLIISLEKIEKYIKNNEVGCYITSSSEDTEGYRKISSKIDSVPIIRDFSNEELAQTLKLENPVHMVIKHGKMAALFIEKVEVLKNVKKQTVERK